MSGWGGAGRGGAEACCPEGGGAPWRPESDGQHHYTLGGKTGVRGSLISGGPDRRTGEQVNDNE